MRTKGKLRTQPNTARAKHKWGSTKAKSRQSPAVQAQVLGLFLTNHKARQISRLIGIDRETVHRIISQQENQILLSGYRDAVMKIVPKALITAYALVEKGDRQMATDILYGTRVLVHRQETETVEPQRERTYAYPKAEFFAKYGRWPSLEEAKEFEKTLDIPLLIKKEASNE